MKKMYLSLMIPTFLLGVSALTGLAADLPLDKKVPMNARVAKGILANGLKYFVMENSYPKDRLELVLVVNAGALLEDDNQNGFAHFVEHMAFNGTRFYPKQQLIDFLESTGIRFGADLNAYTSHDETVYMLTLPLGRSDILQRGFEVLRDWSRFVLLDEKDIDDERGVIMEEWRLRRSAQGRASQQHQKAYFHGSRYAERDVIGDTNVILRGSYDALRSFYNTWYRPENMAVIAIGDLDTSAVIPFIAKHFSWQPDERGVGKGRTQFFTIPENKEPLISIFSDPELTQASMEFVIRYPAAPADNYGSFQTSILDQLASNMINARLQEISRKSKPPFTYASLGVGSFTRTADGFFASAQASDTKNILHSMNALLTEVRRAEVHGFLESELNRAKETLLSRMENLYNERNNTPSSDLAHELVRHFLKAEAVPGIESEYQIYKTMLSKVDLQQVVEHFRKRLTPENRVYAFTIPSGSDYKVPNDTEVKNLLNAIAIKKVAPYEDTTPDKPLMSEKPPKGSIKAKESVDEIGATKYVLSNGATVIYKRTDFKDDELLMDSFAEGGLSTVSPENADNAKLAAGIVDEGGLGEFSATDLVKMLAGKNISCSPYTLDEHVGVRGSTSIKDSEVFFQVLHLTFAQPRLDMEAFASLMSRMESQLANKDASPEASFFDTVTVILSQNHPRKMPLNVERLKTVNADSAFAIYKRLFGNPGAFTFVFAGSVAESDFEDMITTYIASLPASKLKQSWVDHNISPPAGTLTKVINKGKDKKSFSVRALHDKFEYNAKNRFLLSAIGDVLEIKLREKLREELGGVYFVNTQAQPRKIPQPEYVFVVFFGSDPDRAEELLGAVDEVFEAVKKEKVDESYIVKVRETMLKEREVSMRKNDFWISNIRLLMMHEEPFSAIANRQDLINALTTEQVWEAANKFLNSKDKYTFILKPEAP